MNTTLGSQIDNDTTSGGVEKLPSKTWIFQDASIFLTSENSELKSSNFDLFSTTWNKKRKHFIFDKKINVDFSLSEQTDASWYNLVKACGAIKSKEMLFITDCNNYNTNRIKNSGGASAGIATENFTIQRKSHWTIVSQFKPITFISKVGGVYVYPRFIIFDFNGRTELYSWGDVEFKIHQSTMIGHAPSDAIVTGQTWEHVNVSGSSKGSADRRHKDNQKLDKYSVETLQFTSQNADFEFQFSKSGCLTKSFHPPYILFLVSFLEVGDGFDLALYKLNKDKLRKAKNKARVKSILISGFWLGLLAALFISLPIHLSFIETNIESKATSSREKSLNEKPLVNSSPELKTIHTENQLNKVTKNSTLEKSESSSTHQKVLPSELYDQKETEQSENKEPTPTNLEKEPVQIVSPENNESNEPLKIEQPQPNKICPLTGYC